MEVTRWGLCVCSLLIGGLKVGSLCADSLRVWEFGMLKLAHLSYARWEFASNAFETFFALLQVLIDISC